MNRCGNAFKHIKIQNNGDFYDIGEGGDKFATLAELVEHFILKETLRDKNDGTILVLKYPLSYKEPTTERYYHGAISGTDATNLLLEKAKPGSYLVRESRSDPQNYVLCVRCENNKIVHLIISYMVRLILLLHAHTSRVLIIFNFAEGRIHNAELQ